MRFKYLRAGSFGMKAEGFGMKGPSFIGRQHSNSNSQG